MVKNCVSNQIFANLEGIMPHSFRTKFGASGYSDNIQAGYKERTEIWRATFINSICHFSNPICYCWLEKKGENFLFTEIATSINNSEVADLGPKWLFSAARACFLKEAKPLIPFGTLHIRHANLDEKKGEKKSFAKFLYKVLQLYEQHLALPPLFSLNV